MEIIKQIHKEMNWFHIFILLIPYDLFYEPIQFVKSNWDIRKIWIGYKYFLDFKLY